MPMIYCTLSYHRLYQLFGYKRRDIDFEEIMEYLLYRISPREFSFSPFDTQIDGISDCSRGISYKDVTRACEKLPNYLGKPYSVKKMMRLEGKLRRIEIALQNYQCLSFASPFKKIKAWSAYNILRRERIPLQTVFDYFEYRAKALGVGVVSFRKKFMEYAEKFSEPARFFE